VPFTIENSGSSDFFAGLVALRRDAFFRSLLTRRL
jgi:hypothetical protein